MNRIILSTAAALAVAIVPPVYAGGHQGGGGGGHFGGGGGGGARISGGGNFSGSARASGGERSFAPVSRASGGTSFTRVQEAPRAATQAQALSMREPPTRVEQRALAQSQARTIQRQDNNRPAPTIAFGGSAPRDFNREARNDQRVQSGTRSFDRAEVRGSRPSAEVSRHWDRQRIHVWNNHRYHWYNNGWFLYDGGYGYGDPYFYDDTPGYTYYQDSPVYDDQSLAPVEYAAADGMATAVQQALARRGYDPGPIDGAIGPQSRDAIAAFQSDRRMPVTGRIDRALLRALNL